MAHVFALKEAVQHFQQYMTNKSIAEKLGISQGQLMKYANGTTKSCHDGVVDKFYDYFTLDGKPILLDYFPNEATYHSIRLLRDNAFEVPRKALVGSEMDAKNG